LETCGNGYLMVVEGDSLDATAFTSFARKGRDLLNRDDAAASSLLANALRIWKGSALSDVQTGPVLRAHLVGLEEERASVQEQRIDADLRLGRHQELLGELSSLITKYPMHEHLHGKLMLALYRSGRRAQALEVVQRLQKTLRSELGIEPSPQIHQLHQAILACDPLIDLPMIRQESPAYPGQYPDWSNLVYATAHQYSG
jgi:DNA-binding SARP family transcriptional activator